MKSRAFLDKVRVLGIVAKKAVDHIRLIPEMHGIRL